MSLLYYGDYKFSFNESDRNRSSSPRMILLVCSAKLKVKIYSRVSKSPMGGENVKTPLTV